MYLKSDVNFDAVNQTKRETKSLVNDGINVSDVEMVLEGYALRFNPKKGLGVHEVRAICGAGQVYRNEQCGK